MNRIVVIQTAFPGDVILATPVFEALKKIHLESHIAAVVRPESYPLLKNNPCIDEIIVFDKYGKDKGISGVIRVSRLLRDFDWAIIVQRFLRSALIAYLAGIGRRTGFDSSAFRFMYTEKIPYSEDKHEVLRCLDLVGAAGTAKYSPLIFISDDTRKLTDELFAKFSLEDDFAVIAPGSVWPTKRYPHYARLLDMVCEELGLNVVLLGGADDVEISRSISNEARLKPLDFTGKTDLLVSADIISRAKIVFANDSAPTHLAAAVGTPVVAVFGPTIPGFGFLPYSANSRVVDIGELYCRPCTRHGSKKCPEGHFRCMLELAPEKVIDAARSLIAL